MTEIASEQRILGEQIALLHRQAPSILVGTLISNGTLVWLLWDEPLERGHLLGWLSVVVCVILFRWVEYLGYRKDPAALERGAFWAKCFTLGAGLSGLTMGYLGWSFFQPTLLFLFPISLILAAQVALSVPAAGVYFPAHAIFNIVSMTPFMARNFIEEGRLFFWQSFAILFFVISCLLFAYRQQAIIRHAIRLRFDNLDLLARATKDSERARLALREAEEANTAKSRFLAAASHDLRQPLQALALFSHSLSERVARHEVPDSALAGNISASCEGLISLLDALLDLSRAEAGEAPPVIRNVEMSAVLSQMRREFSTQARAKGLRLRVVPTRLLVRTDPALLARVLRNLIANAIRYTQSGGVLVGCRLQGDRVRIEVRDSGIGISADELPNIFREFYQVGNPERDRRKGLGLGLAIVEAVSRQLSHRVEVRSQQGRGSVFSVIAPRGDAVEVAQQPVASNARPAENFIVAVIDDEPLIRAALTQLLGDWGYQVVSGENADDLLRDLASAPDIILADWRLRDGRTGVSEIRHLWKRFDRRIPSILITGESMPDSTLSKEFPVVRKPVYGFKLRAQIQAALEQDAVARSGDL